MPDAELEVPFAPDAVIARIAAAMNRPAKRVLGMRVEKEYVGVVHGREFEVWERRRHAVHLLGRVTGGRNGSRIVLESALTLRARVLIALFFVLYAFLAFGFATLPGEAALGAAGPLVGVLAAGVIAGIFYLAARSQRADLRGFVRRTVDVADPPRPPIS